MGKHSYTPESLTVSSFTTVEPHHRRSEGRGLLGRVAIRTGGALAALAAVGVTIFGVSQVNAISNQESTTISHEAQNDFEHLMGALGSFTLLATAGLAVAAHQASRRYHRQPEEEIAQVVHPFMFADEDDPDMPSRITPVEPVAVYASHEQSLTDELLGGPVLEESYA